MRQRGGSGINWTICRSFAPHSRQIAMPAPHCPPQLLEKQEGQHPLTGQRVVTCFQWRSVPLRSNIKGTELPLANILIPLERQLTALQLC